MNKLHEQPDTDRHENDRLAKEQGTKQHAEEKHQRQAGKTAEEQGSEENTPARPQ